MSARAAARWAKKVEWYAERKRKYTAALNARIAKAEAEYKGWEFKGKWEFWVG